MFRHRGIDHKGNMTVVRCWKLTLTPVDLFKVMRHLKMLQCHVCPLRRNGITVSGGFTYWTVTPLIPMVSTQIHKVQGESPWFESKTTVPTCTLTWPQVFIFLYFIIYLINVNSQASGHWPWAHICPCFHLINLPDKPTSKVREKGTMCNSIQPL